MPSSRLSFYLLQDLTESEAEYVVSCIKHVAPSHIILQFNVTNTLEEQLLERVCVRCDVDDLEGPEVVTSVPAEVVKYGEPGMCFVVLSREGLPTGSVSATLVFSMKEVDPQSGDVEDEGFEDEYQLEDVDITFGDYVTRPPPSAFQRTFQELGSEFAGSCVFNLAAVKSIPEAIQGIMDSVGLFPAEGTDRASPAARAHTMLMEGMLPGDLRVMAVAEMQVRTEGLALKLSVRSPAQELTDTVLEALS